MKGQIAWINDEAREAYELLITSVGSPIKLDCYCERHHVIPRSFGGDNSSSNLVYLTASNHLLAHYWLWIGTGARSMGSAYFHMVNSNWSKYHETPKVTRQMIAAYADAKIAYSDSKREEMNAIPKDQQVLTQPHVREKQLQAISGDNNPMRRPEVVKRVRETRERSFRNNPDLFSNCGQKGANHHMYGKSHTEKAREKMSKAGKGRPKSEEHKRKIGLAHKGRKKPRSLVLLNCRTVINRETGERWDSLADAAKAHNLSGAPAIWRRIKSPNFPLDYDN